MPAFSILLLISLIVLVVVIVSEVAAPGLINEGFVNIPAATYWSTYIAPRVDVGPGKEGDGYIRDPRYFNDYADVTALGYKYDFCRVVASKKDPDNKFFACALAATDNLDPVNYRTKGTKQGFKLSFDDYMHNNNSKGRSQYCRIIKWGDTWAPACVKTGDFTFEDKEYVDKDPPNNIQTRLNFYQGCVLWFRFYNDILDSIGNTNAMLAGGMTIDETPKRIDESTTVGIKFDGVSQFLRLSDSDDLSLGKKVPLRAIRTVMVWVKFESFKNNAKIFDFGNGKGMDNIFLGILRKGDEGIGSEGTNDDGDQSTIPKSPSGPQYVPETSPQQLMKTTAANINDWECKGFELDGPGLRRKEVNEEINQGLSKKKSKTATLIYEVWDKQQRRMRLKMNGVIPLQKWVHVCVATLDNDAFRPTLGLFINGEKVLGRESGFLAATKNMSHCYLGKSNWANAVSQYEDRDELFHGSMFDFRMYQGAVSKDMINDSYKWGKKQLGLS